MRKTLKQQSMMLTMRATRTYPSAQTLGFFDVERRVQWLEAKGNPLRACLKSSSRRKEALTFDRRGLRKPRDLRRLTSAATTEVGVFKQALSRMEAVVNWEGFRRLGRSWLDQGKDCARPESIAHLKPAKQKR